MRNGVVGALLACALVLAACSEESDPVAPPTATEETPSPTYDPTLEPAAAALALVPGTATLLVVTDYDELRLALEYTGLTSESAARERSGFRRDAERDTVLLTSGLLRPANQPLRQDYGFGQDDVTWEAVFSAPAGVGWALELRDGVDMAAVEAAAAAGVGPLAGADVDAERSLVTMDAAATPAESWAADAALTGLVGGRAVTTYVDTACVQPDDVPATAPDAGGAAAVPVDLSGLDELEAFSVSYGTELVTVRLGEARPDTFDRARLPDALEATDPDFDQGYVDAVADPGGGRIGYRIGDPAVAATLARERRLPFAVCAT